MTPMRWALAATVLFVSVAGARESEWYESPEGVAREFVAALDHLDLERILSTQAEDATMFFPHPSASFRAEGLAAIRARMSDAFEQALALARKGGRTTPPYLGLPDPVSVKVQSISETAAVVTWMFDRPQGFGRRTAVMRRATDGWRMVSFHSSNLPAR